MRRLHWQPENGGFYRMLNKKQALELFERIREKAVQMGG